MTDENISIKSTKYVQDCDYCGGYREHPDASIHTCAFELRSDTEKRQICIRCLIKAFDKVLSPCDGVLKKGTQ